MESIQRKSFDKVQLFEDFSITLLNELVKHYPVESFDKTICAVRWILFYLMDRAMHPLNNEARE